MISVYFSVVDSNALHKNWPACPVSDDHSRDVPSLPFPDYEAPLITSPVSANVGTATSSAMDKGDFISMEFSKFHDISQFAEFSDQVSLCRLHCLSPNVSPSAFLFSVSCALVPNIVAQWTRLGSHKLAFPFICCSKVFSCISCCQKFRFSI